MNLLSAWNFDRIEVPGDGDWLFASVITYLLLHHEHPHNDELAFLLGYTPSLGRIDDMIKTLRKAVVQEWLGEHSESYQSFLTGQQLQAEADRFLRMGEFSGDMGNLMLLALSNIPQMPIVVFTSIQNLPPNNRITNSCTTNIHNVSTTWARTLQCGILLRRFNTQWQRR